MRSVVSVFQHYLNFRFCVVLRGCRDLGLYRQSKGEAVVLWWSRNDVATGLKTVLYVIRIFLKLLIATANTVAHCGFLRITSEFWPR
jgi:hypothetical protein